MKGFVTNKKMQDVNVIAFSFSEVTLEERDELRSKLNESLEKGETKFVIDFSETQFLPSLIVTILVAFAKKVRKAGGDVKFCGMSDDLLRIFRIMNLDKVFERYTTVYFALERFKT